MEEGKDAAAPETAPAGGEAAVAKEPVAGAKVGVAGGSGLVDAHAERATSIVETKGDGAVDARQKGPAEAPAVRTEIGGPQETKVRATASKNKGGGLPANGTAGSGTAEVGPGKPPLMMAVYPIPKAVNLAPLKYLGQASKPGATAAAASGEAARSPEVVPQRLLYAPCAELPHFIKEKALQSGGAAVVVEVRIPREELSVENRAFRARQIWGSGIYTDDSDLVCMLQHGGYLRIGAYAPAPSMASEICVKLLVRKHDTSKPFSASERNGLRSRSWCAQYGGLEIAIDEAYTVTRVPAPWASPTPSVREERLNKLVGLDEIAPVLGPVVAESCAKMASALLTEAKRLKGTTAVGSDKAGSKTAGGSSATAAAGRSTPVKRTAPANAATLKAPSESRVLLPRLTVMFSLSNEPCLVYSVAAITECGKDPSHRLSKRLISEVLTLESLSSRFELSQEAFGATLDAAGTNESTRDQTSAADEAEDTHKAKKKARRSVRTQPPFTYRFVCVPNASKQSMFASQVELKEQIESVAGSKAKALALARTGGIAFPKHIPLTEDDDIEVLEDTLSWNEIVWNDRGLWVREEFYPISKFAFVKRTTPVILPSSS
ncbi:hypothetical protein FVE85_2710 [Porphyridium purpureum]|uniref:Uncharacterized protein n=1 Tax=Porphyridium purpureum TaxID=35688 RepID=A0A5J4YSR9_PORPP|nr:hypothetical protein FVE85_2710 [Porphyridium purpureum]|eukprot:POR2323..scf227_4